MKYAFKEKPVAEFLKRFAHSQMGPGAAPKSLPNPSGYQDRIRIENSAGIAIPGGALLYAHAESYDADEGITVQVKRPTASIHPNKLITYIGDFQSTIQVAGADSDGLGWGSRLQYPEWVLADTDTVSPGAEWGPQNGSFKAKKGNRGLIATGASQTDSDTGEFYIRAFQVEPTGIIRGVLLADLDFSSSANITNADSGGTDLVYDYLLKTGESVAAGLKVIAALFPDGKYYVIAAECPDA